MYTKYPDITYISYKIIRPDKTKGLQISSTKPLGDSLESRWGLLTLSQAPARPARCHKCHLLGHTHVQCNSVPRCTQCAGTHKLHECEGKAGPRCINCGLGHYSNSNACPAYLQQLSELNPGLPKPGSRPPPTTGGAGLLGAAPKTSQQKKPAVQQVPKGGILPPSARWATGLDGKPVAVRNDSATMAPSQQQNKTPQVTKPPAKQNKAKGGKRGIKNPIYYVTMGEELIPVFRAPLSQDEREQEASDRNTSSQTPAHISPRPDKQAPAQVTTAQTETSKTQVPTIPQMETPVPSASPVQATAKGDCGISVGTIPTAFPQPNLYAIQAQQIAELQRMQIALIRQGLPAQATTPVAGRTTSLTAQPNLMFDPRVFYSGFGAQ